MFDKNIISSKIAELRRSIPLTQAELADRLGISHQAVSQWERGETLPDITLLPELASLLGAAREGGVELALADDGVRVLAEAGVVQDVRDVAQARRPR